MLCAPMLDRPTPNSTTPNSPMLNPRCWTGSWTGGRRRPVRGVREGLEGRGAVPRAALAATKAKARHLAGALPADHDRGGEFGHRGVEGLITVALGQAQAYQGQGRRGGARADPVQGVGRGLGVGGGEPLRQREHQRRILRGAQAREHALLQVGGPTDLGRGLGGLGEQRCRCRRAQLPGPLPGLRGREWVREADGDPGAGGPHVAAVGRELEGAFDQALGLAGVVLGEGGEGLTGDGVTAADPAVAAASRRDQLLVALPGRGRALPGAGLLERAGQALERGDRLRREADRPRQRPDGGVLLTLREQIAAEADEGGDPQLGGQLGGGQHGAVDRLGALDPPAAAIEGREREEDRRVTGLGLGDLLELLGDVLEVALGQGVEDVAAAGPRPRPAAGGRRHASGPDLPRGSGTRGPRRRGPARSLHAPGRGRSLRSTRRSSLRSTWRAARAGGASDEVAEHHALRGDLEVGLGREHVVLLGLAQRQRPQLEDLPFERPQPALRDGRGTNAKWRADRVHGHEHEGRQPPGEQGRGAQLEVAGVPQAPAWRGSPEVGGRRDQALAREVRAAPRGQPQRDRDPGSVLLQVGDGPDQAEQ
jgi:hypothetical protein